MKIRGSLFQNIILFIALAAFLFLGIAYIVSNDRRRYADEQLKNAIRDWHDILLEKRNFSASPARHLSVNSSGQVQNKTVIPGANAEFFDPAARSGDRLITIISSDAGNLNPLTNNDAAVSEFWALANASLTERNYADLDRFEPMLAESWSLSQDKRTWRIQLRKGVLWHDFTDPVTGKKWKNVPVTAHDFKFYVDAVKNEDVDASPLRGYLNGIKEIRVFNDYEFDVVWKDRYFLARDITLGLSPLPRHLYHAYDGPFDGKRFNDDSARNRIIVGCGPYRFVKWEKGRRIVFRRFEKYFGRDCGIMPSIRDYVFEIIQHPGTRLQAMVSGGADRNQITPEQWLYHTGTPEFGPGGTLQKICYPSYSYNYIGLNLALPLFQDRRVRVALSHLVDRKRILRDVYRGLARAVSGSFFMDSAAYDKSIPPYPFDVEKARTLFSEAGWKDTDGDGILDKNGVPFQFTLMFPGANPNYLKIAPILKEDMAKAGVRLELLSLEWSVVVQRIEQRKFEASMLGWTTPLTSDPYQLWHSANAAIPGSSNYISFANPDADRLIEKIRTTFDDAERNRAYHRFHRLLHEEAPYLFLFSPSNLLLMSRRYRNLRVFPTGVPDQILWTPRNEQKSVPGL